jgi:DNA repair protein RadC
MTDVIREMPTEERPRERLLMHGPDTLSDTDLVAVLLGSGRRGKNAIQLARELLCEGGLGGLRAHDAAHYRSTIGIGTAKAARLAAAFELARRIAGSKRVDPPPFELHELATKLVRRCGDYTQERLGAWFLDGRHRIMKQREIFVGTINNALVSTNDIVRYALLDRAAAIVVYHNHPSGNFSPSPEDTTFTTKLKESLDLVDVELVDHLIIGKHGFFSMKQKGLI